MKETVAIGLDVGHSAVKMAFELGGKVQHVLFRSMAIPAFQISDHDTAVEAARETVRVGDRDYFFGETAWTQSGGLGVTGLNQDWIDTTEHKALIAGALKLLDDAGVPAQRLLVMGLPSATYGQQAQKLKEIVASLTEAEIKVYPQPMGPYQGMLLDARGIPNPSLPSGQRSWGVVDMGRYSTDFMLMMNGKWVEKASGSCGGFRLAAEHLQKRLEVEGILADLGECEDALRERRITNFGKRLDIGSLADEAIQRAVPEIIDTATRLMEPFVRKLDGVLVAGGPAEILYPAIKAKWPHAVLAQQPRLAVAEGFRRLGRGLLLARAIAA